MAATIGKSRNVHKAQSRADATRTRVSPSNAPRSQGSKAAAHTAGTRTDSRGRPVAQLRKIDEAAQLFSTSARSVRRFIACGALPVIRLGRSVRISDDDIAAFLAANRSD